MRFDLGQVKRANRIASYIDYHGHPIMSLSNSSMIISSKPVCCRG